MYLFPFNTMNCLLLTLLLCLLGAVSGGGPCPPREDIYPCSCRNVAQTKKLTLTMVDCHRLVDTQTLQSVFSSLRNVQIDQLHLFDSFWESHRLDAKREDNRGMPIDWLNALKVKEFEIYDTALASCFACKGTQKCRSNIATISFKAVNSSTSDSFCGLCQTPKGDSYSWTSCLSRLQHFRYTHGRMSVLGPDLFPLDMPALTSLDLSHNRIVEVKPNSLKRLKRLAVLNLSHNMLRDVAFIEAEAKTLEVLDVSWNQIKQLSDPFFGFVTSLKTLNLANNEIVDLKESQWKKTPQGLRLVDLTENPIHCDCSIRFVNATFHINTVIEGTCATPEEYENSVIRKTSRNLIERCDKDGNIGTRSTKKKNAPHTSPSPFSSFRRSN